MKRLIYIVTAFSLLLCSLPAGAEPVTVNVKATGEIELVPDMGGITVSVSCTDQVLAASTDCTKKGIDALFALLKEHKIPKEDYHSSAVNLEKEYIWQDNSQVFNGYKSSSTVSILFKNLDTMSAVISRTMTMKNAEVFNLTYSHSELEAYSNKAYLKALDNAKALAEEIRKKLGGKTLEIVKISNMDNVRDNLGSPESGLLKEKEYRSQAAAPIQINPGALKLIKDIYVQYVIGL